MTLICCRKTLTKFLTGHVSGNWSLTLASVYYYESQEIILMISLQFSYILNNQTIQLSNTYRYLGVTFTSTLTWNTHISNVTNRATKMLNFIKRNIGKCTNQIKSKVYMSLIRLILEYATQVWDPYQKTLIHK